MNISFNKRFLFFLFICFLIYLQGIFKLPVMDRDEARFATASKTMLIEKDFIDIKMVEEKRYKKPIGIYWTQSLMNSIFGSYPYDKISIYRLPSILGVFISFFLIFVIIRNIENESIAFLTVFFLIFSFLTISEIHQAKTDGLLFLFIGICNLIIYKLINFRNLSFPNKIFFWIAMSFGILIKGPIIIIFTFFPLIIFSILRKRNFIKDIWSTFGFVLLLLITIPWFVLINIKSGGAFWYESVGNDLFNKVKSGQESHGFPPGYYSLLLFIFFWPGSIFIINLFLRMKERFKYILKKDDFLLYLIISFGFPLIIFELIPTKLPHYIYPAYLPLSILVAKFIAECDYNKKLLKFSLFPIVLFPLTIISLITVSIHQFSEFDVKFVFVIMLYLILSLFLLKETLKKKIKSLLISSGCFQIFTYLVLIFFLLPRLEVLWISDRINGIINKHEKSVEKIFTVGFNEPSLLFLTSHKSSNSSSILGYKKEKDEKILLIVTDIISKNIKDNKNFSDFLLIEEFKGFNYSKGENVIFKVYKN